MSIGCKKNGTWYIQYRIPGEKYPVREYTGIGKDGEVAARELDRQIKEQKATGAITKRVQRPGRIHLDQLAQAYLTERKLSGKSAQWLEEMETLFNKKILPRLCFCPVDELKYPDVIAMAAEV